MITGGLVKDDMNLGADQRSANYMGGAQEAGRGLIGQDDNFSQGLGFGDQAMSAAIKSKYNAKYNLGENRLAHEMKKAGQDDQIKKLQVTSQLASEEHQMNLQKEILRRKKIQAKKAARGQIIGQVLGITGAVAGGVIGAAAGGAGAPMGAMAGYQAGTALGGAVGSM